METPEYRMMLMESRMTPERLKEQQDRLKASRLKILNDQLEIEELKRSFEESQTKNKTIRVRIAVLELKKEQLMRD